MQAADQQKLTRAAAAAAVHRSSAALVHLLGHEEMVKMKVVSTQSGLEPGQHFSGNYHSHNRMGTVYAPSTDLGKSDSGSVDGFIKSVDGFIT